MKRAVIAACILTIVVSLSAALLINLKSSSEAIRVLVDDMGSAVLSGDRDKSISIFNEIAKSWDERELLISIATGKKKTEPIGLCINRLKASIETFKEELIMLELGQLNTLVENLWDDERPALENML